MEEVRNGFDSGIKPELSLYGSGGTYFLNDYTKWNLLVFKPEDEEPFAENNPRRLYLGRQLHYLYLSEQFYRNICNCEWC